MKVKIGKHKIAKLSLVFVGSVSILLAGDYAARAGIFDDIGGFLGNVGGYVDGANEISDWYTSLTGEDLSEVETAIGQISGYLSDARDYLDKAEFLEAAIKSGNPAAIYMGMREIAGELGIPDPFRLRQKIEANTEAEGTKGDPSTAQANANVMDRFVVGGLSASVLGQEGQAVIKTQQKQQEAISKQSNKVNEGLKKLAAKTQKKNISQDILKDIVPGIALIGQQQGLQLEIDRQMSSQLTAITIQQAGSNLLLKGIGSTLDSEQLLKNLERDERNLLEQQTSAQIYIPGAHQPGAGLAKK